VEKKREKKNSGKRVWLWVELKKKWKKKSEKKNSGKRGWLITLTHDL